MSSDPTKHPKKKRRIDDVPEDNHLLPGPSNEAMALVSPQLVKKSSKDPNRGMYPVPKGKHRKINSGTCPPSESVKAPIRCYSRKILSQSPQRIKKEKLIPIASTAQNINSEAIEQHSSSDLYQLNVKDDRNSTSTNTERKLNISAIKKKHESKVSHSSHLCKNVKYKKTSSSGKQKNTRQKSVKHSISDLSEELPGTSGSGWNRAEIDVALADVDNEDLFKSIRHCYGLVNTDTGSTENEVDYFKILPTHIIEYILCQIPIVDLMTCRLVCMQWRDIIDNEKFMEWKKLYYKFKKTCSEPYSDPKTKINDLLIQYGYNVLDDSIGAILRYMGRGFNRIPSSDMYGLLIQNPKGELADLVLSERFPEFNGKDSRVWCQFTVAILISETVWDIFNIYKSLCTRTSSCPLPDVIDAMYCIASYLLLFQSWNSVNSGLHFRLYYVLYLLENHIPDFLRHKLKLMNRLPEYHKQSIYSCSLSDFDYLTLEQKRALNHQFDMNQKIRIIALAGTGKTTTLIHLTRLYPQMKFLYLSFNKLVSEEAKKRFPLNVVCKTAHSLAYADSGHPLHSKLTAKVRPHDLISHLAHNEDKTQNYIYANLVLSTITNFIISKSTEMDLSHIPDPSRDGSNSSLAVKNRDRILKDAYKIWRKMINKNDPFKITHDVYLKLYHLKRPIFDEYQCIMVDEAQDCNPVILDIVTSQSIPIIFVGDPYQQIYRFRGAKNALQRIEATHTYHLTQSFRFGSEIAYVAACVLQELLNKIPPNIVGNTKDSFVNGKVGGQYAVIARTNSGLFNEALRMIVYKRLRTNEPLFVNSTFAGGINSYGFDQMLQIYYLKNISEGFSVEDKFISKFKSFTDLVNYARYSEDSDLLSKIEIVNQHGHDITHYIYVLKDKCNHPMELANVVFSTAHKAKGLEFDTVYLTDDYPISISTTAAENAFASAQEEASILYVALTRAKRFLLLPEKIRKVFIKAHEKFEYPVSSKSILETNAVLKCVHCRATFTPHTVLTMVRRKIILASGRDIREGPMCMKCSTDPNMRPDIHINGLIMYLDPTIDCSHRFMSSLVGPLPTDPPIVHDSFEEYRNAERIFVINLNLDFQRR